MADDRYKLLTYLADGHRRAGILVGDRAYDVAALTGSERLTDLDVIISQWQELESTLAAAIVEPRATPIKLADVRVLAPLAHPAAIYCAGSNYKKHNDAMAKARDTRTGPSPKELGLPPFFFLKSSNCITGTDTEVSTASESLDYEVELAMVIGQRAFNITADRALDCVAGYTIANDLSARDRILRNGVPAETPFKWDWLSHKNFDGSCPLGPFIVPASFIPDPQNLSLKTWVNDELRQASSTSEMLYSIVEIIVALSKYNTLHPGDVILTGTPAGVGAETSNFLKGGDRITMEIEGIGTLRNTVRASP